MFLCENLTIPWYTKVFFVFHQHINYHYLQLVADLLEKRAPFNGMRGKRGEEIAVQQPDQVNILAAADADDGGGGGGAHVHVVQRG